MSIKRYTGTSFVEVGSRKRFNGTAWVALSFGKRWNGSAWVDLWSDSSGGGGSSGSSGGSGTPVSTTASGALFTNVKSTVSSPTVCYSADYVITRSGTSASVALTFRGWLNSSSSHLGSGIKLTVFARMNGGAWVSAVIKQNNSSWSGTAKHAASLNLSGSASGRVKIEFYVTRSGSSYGGSAGTLGSASSPKTYYID